MSEEYQVDLNEASAEELEEVGQLDGQRARHLVEHRDRAGRFRTWDDVKRVPSFEEGMVERLQQAGFTIGGERAQPSIGAAGGRAPSGGPEASAGKVSRRSSAAPRQRRGGGSLDEGSGRRRTRAVEGGHDLNRATAEELEQVHMIGAERARRLLAFREQRGPFTDWEQVKEVLGYEEGLVERLQQAGFGIGGRGR